MIRKIRIAVQEVEHVNPIGGFPHDDKMLALAIVAQPFGRMFALEAHPVHQQIRLEHLNCAFKMRRPSLQSVTLFTLKGVACVVSRGHRCPNVVQDRRDMGLWHT